MRVLVSVLLVLSVLAPIAAAQPAKVEGVRATAGNQRVDLSWEPALGASSYAVMISEGGAAPREVRPINATQTTLFLTNGVTYVFVVVGYDANGTIGSASDPVAATPSFANDMQYLAAGLIVTWLAVFGYAAFLARRESQLDRKLEQLLSHRQGRTP